MPDLSSQLITALTALGTALLILWFISIITQTVSFIDSFWATGFIIIAVSAWITAGRPESPAQLLTLALVLLWGARLSLYLLRRYLKDGEDQRYVRMTDGKKGWKRHWFTLYFVFGLQGALIIIIGLPLISAFSIRAPYSLDALSYIGIAVWLIGAIFEWGGDWQLAKFKSDPENQGKVMDQGLWKYTRHPNYFGDACAWWGMWLVTHDFALIYAPALMTFILLKWSGVPLLEKSLKKTRPGYADYIARTSNFIPRPPKTL